ncbi:hypothetical protein P7K49_001037, partial [Saguinus oedipus]
ALPQDSVITKEINSTAVISTTTANTSAHQTLQPLSDHQAINRVTTFPPKAVIFKTSSSFRMRALPFFQVDGSAQQGSPDKTQPTSTQLYLYSPAAPLSPNLGPLIWPKQTTAPPRLPLLPPHLQRLHSPCAWPPTLPRSHLPFPPLTWELLQPKSRPVCLH